MRWPRKFVTKYLKSIPLSLRAHFEIAKLNNQNLLLNNSNDIVVSGVQEYLDVVCNYGEEKF